MWLEKHLVESENKHVGKKYNCYVFIIDVSNSFENLGNLNIKLYSAGYFYNFNIFTKVNLFGCKSILFEDFLLFFFFFQRMISKQPKIGTEYYYPYFNFYWIKLLKLSNSSSKPWVCMLLHTPFMYFELIF